MFFGRFTIRWRSLAEASVLVRAPFLEFVHKLDAYVMVVSSCTEPVGTGAHNRSRMGLFFLVTWLYCGNLSVLCTGSSRFGEVADWVGHGRV